jgi:hypothetical protein
LAAFLKIPWAVWIPRMAIAEIILTLLEGTGTSRVAWCNVFQIALTVVQVFLQLRLIRRVDQNKAHSFSFGRLQLLLTKWESGICSLFQVCANTARSGTAAVYTL